ncbi:MAG: response regulator [Candidatus Hydrogenedentes bacterium]|nr:response regulator [Candidatus Hydrogenedentota bacterium]
MLDTELDDEQRDHAETILESSNALLAIINDILDFSKVEAGRLELEVIDFDLRIAIEEVLDLLAVRAQEKGLEIASLVEPGVPSRVKGDPGRLRQILINLVSNAIKFTEHGEVIIHATLDQESEHLSTIRFAVTDTGIGIPKDRMDRLFKSFSQVDSSTTRRYGGTGLGLAISMQLANLMGGEIGVESEEGKGSTFWFTCRLEHQRGADTEEEFPLEPIEGQRILVVDDNQTNRAVLSQQLNRWGCHCEVVADGRSALDAIRVRASAGTPFDLVLIDSLMPEMDGQQLASAIRADAVLGDPVLVMITSSARRGEASRFHELGFVAYLTKPVKRSQLYDCLRAALGTRRHGESEKPQRLITRHSVVERKKYTKRILVAEDNPINQKVALRVIEKLGYRADAVANGMEAVSAVKRLPYDLILMDGQMPEMDGIEATRIIRQGESGAKRRIPIVALTAHAMQGDRDRYIAAGMDDYLAKPLQPRELAEMIERYVGDGTTVPEIPKERPGKGSRKPVFNRRALLARLDNDTELFDELVQVFLADCDAQFGRMRSALSQRDATSLSRLAHTLKGSALNVEAGDIADSARTLEASAAKQDWELVDAALKDVELALQKFKSVIVVS